MTIRNLASKLVMIGMFGSLSAAIAYLNSLHIEIAQELEQSLESSFIKRGIHVAATTKGGSNIAMNKVETPKAKV